MHKDRRLQIASLTLIGLCALLLLLGVLQLNSLQGKVITQTQQLRALGETTEELSGKLERISVEGVSAKQTLEAKYADVKLLHPEVENFLQPWESPWPPEGAQTDGVLMRGWSSGDPKGFNPLTENAAEIGQRIGLYTSESLANRNVWSDPNKWHGELAWRVEITDDFKEYTFYLHQGVMWHPVSGVDITSPKYQWLDKPHEVTAHDFVFTLDMILHPQVENGATKNYYEDVESYKAVDKYTLVVRWKKKTRQSLTFTLGLGPLAKFLWAYDEDGSPYAEETIGLRFNQHWYNNKGVLGTGPYRFERYQPGVKIELVRHENYRGDKPAIKRFSYPIYTDRKQTVLKLKAGEINFGHLTPMQYREEVLRWREKPKAQWPKNNPFLNGTIECSVEDYPVYRYIGWNADKPLFADAKVRRAMTLALNRKDILEAAFAGLGTVAHGPFLPSTGLLDPNIEPLDFDLQRAKKLLTEAGWTDTDGDGLLDKKIGGQRKPFEFTLMIYGNRAEYTTLANIFKDDLLKIGVKMNIESAEWALMQKKMDEKKFDAFTGGWALPWESDPYQLWHSSQADIPKGSNRVGFRNKKADAIIEKLRETFDEEKRVEMFRELHRIIHDSQAYTFLIVEKAPFCWRKEVRGITFAKVRPVANALPWWVSSSN